MRWVIWAGLVGLILVVAFVLSVSPYDDSFLNNEVVSENSPKEKDFNNSTLLIISYNMEPIPDVSNKQIIQNALEDAFSSWEEENENLEFQKTDNFADLQIEWQTVAADTHVGLATYSEKYKGIVTIGLGKFDCNNNFVQYDSNLLHQTIMHEIGHILGLGHHNEETHLMYGVKGIDLVSIDNFEYIIPEYRDGFFEGYIQLENNYDILNSKLEELSEEIEELERQYDVMNTEYEITLSELENDIQYLNQINLMEQEMAQVNYQIYSIIDEYDNTVHVMNEIVDEMSCFPDVDK